MKRRQVTDTTDFCSIDVGDTILINEKEYEVIGHAREMRFGLEDPKYWVKWVIDLDTGEKKIIKLSFFESFELNLAGVKIKRFRDPVKEGNILTLVKGHPYFMQGTSYNDAKGNNIRVIKVVRGQSFLEYIDTFKMDYEKYMRTVLPGILRQVIRAFEGIRFLHINGFKHGDIRNDHLYVESNTGNYVWIDFDYDFESTENPFALDIFGMGNILIYAIGKGFHNNYRIRNDEHTYGHMSDSVKMEDFAILNKTRFVNLKKIYPMIPETLNNILMNFSNGADVYYDQTDEIIEDLNRCLQAFS